MATTEVRRDAAGNPIYTADDGIQHGIDDNPNDDAQKGAAIGGVGGAIVGAAAGAMTGPIGAVIGAVVGGAAGAAASGAAVAAVDRVENDDTVSGMGDGITPDKNAPDAAYTGPIADDRFGVPVAPLDPIVADDPRAYTPPVGNGTPGVQTGGRAVDGTPDTRGISEKAADAVTGDRWDDKTGKAVR